MYIDMCVCMYIYIYMCLTYYSMIYIIIQTIIHYDYSTCFERVCGYSCGCKLLAPSPPARWASRRTAESRRPEDSGVLRGSYVLVWQYDRTLKINQTLKHSKPASPMGVKEDRRESETPGRPRQSAFTLRSCADVYFNVETNKHLGVSNFPKCHHLHDV